MKHFTVQQIDLSKYLPISVPIEVVGGSRPHLTLTHKKTKQLFLFKTYTHNPREVWAECLASHIADLAGIKAQAVTIKVAPKHLENTMRSIYEGILPNNWKPVGTLARNIFPRNIEITYGSAIAAVSTNALTLEEIQESIATKYYAPSDILQSFADMLVFDTLIGNMDRHPGNWGICEDKRYKQQLLFDKKRLVPLRWFTPLFDHGSSLMFELSDKNVNDMIADENNLEHYVISAKSGFLLGINHNKTNPFDLLAEHLKNNTTWAHRLKQSMERIKQIHMLDVAELVIQMPLSDMLDYSEERRHLLFKALLLRYNKIIKMYEEYS